MRMKLFSAATMEEAMELMRAELGPDAVILSTRNEPGCVEVRAAVERPLNHRFAAPVFSEVRPTFDTTTRDRMSEVLRWHGAPDAFTDVVTNAGVKLMGASADPGPALAAAAVISALTFIGWVWAPLRGAGRGWVEDVFC